MLYQLFGDANSSSFGRSVLLPESVFDMIKAATFLLLMMAVVVISCVIQELEILTINIFAKLKRRRG